MNTATEIRLHALTLAVKGLPENCSAEVTMNRAEAFEKFLRGQRPKR